MLGRLLCIFQSVTCGALATGYSRQASPRALRLAENKNIKIILYKLIALIYIKTRLDAVMFSGEERR
jgi:hypothetical protein